MSENQSEQQQLSVGEARVIDLTSSSPRTDLKFYKVFSIEYKDPKGRVWEGTFTIKRLTLGDLTKVGIRSAQLDGGLMNIPENIQYINRMLAHCDVAMVERPSWFKPDEMYDQDLLVAVYGEVAKFEESFR